MFYSLSDRLSSPAGSSASLNISAARDFVRRFGSALDRAFLEPLPVQTLLDLLRQYQNVDGGWVPGLAPASYGLPGTIMASAEALHLIIALGLGRTTLCYRTLQYLDRRQQTDGAWDDDVLATSMIANAMQQLDPAAHGSVIARAKAWLRPRIPAALTAYPAIGWHSLALFGATDAAAAPEDGRIVAGCITHLQQIKHLQPAELASILDACAIIGLSHTDPLVSHALNNLSRQQQLDGGWHAEEEDQRARTTALILHALKNWSGAQHS